MKILKFRTTGIRSAVAVAATLALCAAPGALAQQTQTLKFTAPTANTKYTQQHVINAGDAPSHEVRIFEIHRTFPKDPPQIGGVRVKETWARGYSDYFDLNGTAVTYTTYVMENGDKFYTRTNVLSQNAASADGAKKGATNMTSGSITGGTGKFVGIRGTVRTTGAFDPKAGTNQTQLEMVYWMEK